MATTFPTPIARISYLVQDDTTSTRYDLAIYTEEALTYQVRYLSHRYTQVQVNRT